MTTQAKPDRPVPVPTRLTEPFWTAAKNRQLAMQRCSQCGHYHHPPLPMCPECHSHDLSFAPVSGRGVIYERVINHQAGVAGFQQVAPYAVIAVELEEQPRLLFLSNLVEAPAAAAQVGLPVEVTFEEIRDGFLLPVFRPRRG